MKKLALLVGPALENQGMLYLWLCTGIDKISPKILQNLIKKLIVSNILKNIFVNFWLAKIKVVFLSPNFCFLLVLFWRYLGLWS